MQLIKFALSFVQHTLKVVIKTSSSSFVQPVLNSWSFVQKYIYYNLIFLSTDSLFTDTKLGL